jgi:hypothetical protein
MEMKKKKNRKISTQGHFVEQFRGEGILFQKF